MGRPTPTNVEAEQHAASSNSSTRPIPSQARIAQPIHHSSQPRFITPKTFRASISAKVDNPLVSLFRLGVRILQFVFALTSGISYAIELGHVQRPTNFIFAQVVFGLTLVVLLADGFIVRTYKFTWMIEWLLAILYWALFGVFFSAYSGDTVGELYKGADAGGMRRAAWMDLINALLWTGSALFASFMCCAGTKAALRGKLERRRQRKGKGKAMEQMKELDEMEQGTVRPSEERLPGYEEAETQERH